MARIDNLSNFLTDIADSIRSKKGTTDKLSPENFDTEIEGIETNSNPTLQIKAITITENGTQSVTPDEGYNGLEKVNITTNVSGGSESRLPNGYTEVEYIESTGTQYVDTGVLPDTNTKLDIDFSYTNTTSNTQLVGSRKSWNQQGFYVGTKTNTVGSMFWIEFGSSFIERNLPISDKNRHTISFSKKFYYDNVLKGSFSDTVTLDGYANIILFGSNEGEKNAVVPSAYKIYSCQIYENEEKIRDFVPCIQDETEIVGLYDLINNVFYGNSGTGSFNKGNIVLEKKVDFVYDNSGYPIEIMQSGYYDDAPALNNLSGEFFSKCTKITLDESITTVPKKGFENDSYVEEIVIKNNNANYLWSSWFSAGFGTSGMFSKCTKLKKITGIINAIYADMFMSSPALTEFTLSENITGIPAQCFEGCSALAWETLPTHIKSLGTNSNGSSTDGRVFYNCASLKLKEINNDVVLASKNASRELFYNCKNITLKTLPSSWKNLKASCFYGCENLLLESLENVTYIDSSCFYDCKNMPLKKLSDNLTYIGQHAFQNCKLLNINKIPVGVTTIDYYTFYNCTGLVKISIAGAKNIYAGYAGSASFGNCTNLKKVWISSNITSAGFHRYVFCGCTALEKIYIDLPRATVETFANYKYAFMNDTTKTGIIVCNDDEGFITKEEFDVLEVE